MTRGTESWLRAGAVIGLVLAFGCKRAETPTGALPADASAPASEALEKAASETKSSPGAAAPETAAQDPEAARKAVDAMLQDVRKQLEQKTSELGKLQPNEPPKP